MKKCLPSIQCWDSNPRPSEYESPPITTRPGLPPSIVYLLLLNRAPWATFSRKRLYYLRGDDEKINEQSFVYFRVIRASFLSKFLSFQQQNDYKLMWKLISGNLNQLSPSLRLVQTGCVKRIRLGCFLWNAKTHPNRKDPIYCALRSELRRSERAVNP